MTQACRPVTCSPPHNGMQVSYQHSYVTVKERDTGGGRDREGQAGALEDVGEESDAEEVEAEDRVKAYR